ncbi:MAG TPA: VWA domain-containing protein [Thermoanaerobaculia bacterium]|nr:VWA domain-containing protein [Thermoanaerobaculia bacterium]
MKSLLLGLLIALPMFAADGPKLGETIDVSVVNIDAIVTDHQGNRVRGLTKDDFKIFENGKSQPISNFSEINDGDGVRQALSLSGSSGQAPGQAPGQAGELVLHHQPRTIIVFIEHFRAPDFRRDSFFNGMREFLHRTVRPGDAVKIVTFAKRAETRLAFTDKLDAIDRTLDEIRSESGPGVDDTTFEDYILGETFTSHLNASSRGRSIAGFTGAGGMGIAPNNPRDFSSTDFGTTASTRPATNSQQNFRVIRMRDKVAAITSLMNSIAGTDSKKVFVLAVRRFSPTGRDLFEVDNFTPNYGWSNRFRSDTLIDYVAKSANANGITVYPLHPEGLGSDGFGIESLHDYNLMYSQLPYLDELARQTGGKLAWGKDIETDLPKMAEDLDAYYSIGYRATNHNVDRARSIVVKAKNPDYTIRSRREYVEKSDQTRMRERVLAALLDQAPASSMNINVKVGQNRFVANSGYHIPITIYIPSAALMTDGGRGEFSVFVAWSGKGGQLGQVTKQSQKFKLTPNMPETFTYTFEMLTDGMTDQLSVGVFDELSKDYGLRRIDLSSTAKIAGIR